MMAEHPSQQTLGELRHSGYTSRPVRDELRENLVRTIRERGPMFPDIHGYEDTVIPQLQNAILAGHDLILLGERGQAKTRIARELVSYLDPWIPIVTGSEVNDDPFRPISAFGKSEAERLGDALPIEWVPRDRRFAEKLATPDTTVADLIGEVDPIKVAEGRYLSNEEVISFGLIPRTNRGILNLNELPDLAERIQVGLLNILEEQDVQIRGFQVRIPVDIFVVASANPEDYTNRGRIITPLKDRFGSQIRTHYPRTIAMEIEIADQERANVEIPGMNTFVPPFMLEVIAEISHHARRSADVAQRSGVSVRTTIANLEAVIANAQRRAMRHNETNVVPRISDLPAVYPATMGKIEFETFGEGKDEQILERIIADSVRTVFLRHVDMASVEPLVHAFENGLAVTIAEETDAFSVINQVSSVDGLDSVARGLAAQSNPAAIAAGVELVLEGLHQVRKVSRKSLRGESGVSYRR